MNDDEGLELTTEVLMYDQNQQVASTDVAMQFKRPDLSGSSIFISAGRLDPIVPADSVEQLAEIFRSGNADVTLKWQISGHNLIDHGPTGAVTFLQYYAVILLCARKRDPALNHIAQHQFQFAL